MSGPSDDVRAGLGFGAWLLVSGLAVQGLVEAEGGVLRGDCSFQEWERGWWKYLLPSLRRCTTSSLSQPSPSMASDWAVSRCAAQRGPSTCETRRRTRASR
eukprot:2181199-Rhodomonas_salina.1